MPKLISPKKIATALEMVKNGASYRSVSLMMNVDPVTVRNWCKRKGISSRHLDGEQTVALVKSVSRESLLNAIEELNVKKHEMTVKAKMEQEEKERKTHDRIRSLLRSWHVRPNFD